MTMMEELRSVNFMLAWEDAMEGRREERKETGREGGGLRGKNCKQELQQQQQQQQQHEGKKRASRGERFLRYLWQAKSGHERHERVPSGHCAGRSVSATRSTDSAPRGVGDAAEVAATPASGVRLKERGSTSMETRHGDIAATETPGNLGTQGAVALAAAVIAGRTSARDTQGTAGSAHPSAAQK